jgi:C4-dicarboxylate-specific signal transduction histidine kinase
VLGILRSELLLRNVTPIARLAPMLPMIEGDRVRLQQVLINLIVNGCDAMMGVPVHRRQMVLETSNVGEGFVQASVADRGPGFASENAVITFEPFRTTKPSGLGLGLPICRSIIETHGGKLWAVNGKDGGAVVNFTLPISNGGDN